MTSEGSIFSEDRCRVYVDQAEGVARLEGMDTNAVDYGTNCSL
jgi:hypothetical protein